MRSPNSILLAPAVARCHWRGRTWGALLLLAALAANAQTPNTPNTPQAPPPPANTPLTREQLRADLRQFQQEFVERDAAYSPTARAEAHKRLAELGERAKALDHVSLSLALAAIAALADNGHSQVLAAPRLARSNRVPLRLAPLGEHFHVMRCLASHAALLGARLVAIDGVPLARLRDAAHQLTGGTQAWRDRVAPFLFESPEQLHRLGLIAQAGAATYRLALTDGRVLEQRLDAEPPDPGRPSAATERLLLPEVTTGHRGYVSALALEQAPWSLRDALTRLRWRHDPALDAVVIEMRGVFDTPTLRLQDYFAQVQAAIATQRPQHLVLDLRMNGGGDLTKGRDFAERLPSLVPGRMFVLTSGWTFSAAISLAAYAKQAAPSRVALVGEAAGDGLNFFAEGRVVTLAHSRVALLPALERHDYAGGCDAHDDCHAPVKQRPLRLSTLQPEISAPWTYEAWRAGRDPAMEAVAAALAKR